MLSNSSTQPIQLESKETVGFFLTAVTSPSSDAGLLVLSASPGGTQAETLLDDVVAAMLLVTQRLLAAIGFGMLSGDAGIEAAGRDYFNARIWAAPATLTNFVLIGWLLGRERARAALVMTVVANLCNDFTC